jgi:2-dehydro-3-deoxyphosphogluconate aldolase/(4S)-4-hydroxy-2-oxoglutarate aldolase
MTPAEKTAAIDRMLEHVPVMPVMTVSEPDEAVALGRALADGGITVLEITLRTEAALACIAALRKALPACMVGAGTVLDDMQLAAALKAGAQFIVTPGTSQRFADKLASAPVPALPGCATVSEMLTLAAAGFDRLKFFPAEAAGGAAYLKAVSAPVPQVKFCPTGGIDAGKAAAYLALPNVICVGGSWLAPAAAVRSHDWSAITRLARDAVALRPGKA